VVDVRIDVNREALVVGLERGLIGGNTGIDALVEPGVVQQQRRLDRPHLVRRRLQAVVSDRGLELGRKHGDAVDHASAPAEADRAHGTG